MTSTAPDSRASAPTPVAGLISGTADAPPITKLDRPAKSNIIPAVFIRDLLA
jgi:hypothetical protein